MAFQKIELVTELDGEFWFEYCVLCSINNKYILPIKSLELKTGYLNYLRMPSITFLGVTEYKNLITEKTLEY